MESNKVRAVDGDVMIGERHTKSVGSIGNVHGKVVSNEGLSGEKSHMMVINEKIVNPRATD